MKKVFLAVLTSSLIALPAVASDGPPNMSLTPTNLYERLQKTRDSLAKTKWENRELKQTVNEILDSTIVLNRRLMAVEKENAEWKSFWKTYAEGVAEADAKTQVRLQRADGTAAKADNIAVGLGKVATRVAKLEDRVDSPTAGAHARIDFVTKRLDGAAARDQKYQYQIAELEREMRGKDGKGGVKSQVNEFHARLGKLEGAK